MREAIGGTWLFGIVILFIALFASFLAYSISYTRAFNVKNEIINLIERSEGYTNCADGDSTADENVNTKSECNVKNMSDIELENNKSVEAQAFLKIKKAGYNYSAAETIDCKSVGHIGERATKDGGYCVTKYCSDFSGDEGKRKKYSTYYKVTTFIALRLPVVNITFNIPISGETRTIYYDSGKMNCDN